MIKLPEPAKRPTMYFVGVTTGQSSIMKMFPIWAKELGLDAEIKGIDLPIHAPAEDYRAVVQFFRDDPLSLGALVTTHKIDMYNAAKDMFDYLDPYAQRFGELSSISKLDGQLRAHAKDPISSGLALDAFVPEGHWLKTGAEVCIIGAGGSALSISAYLGNEERHGKDLPSRIHLNNRSAPRLAEGVRILEYLNVPMSYHLCKTPELNDRIVEALPAGSLVINATGLGKDRPGSPLTDHCKFPENGLVWELNYRGTLEFMHQAEAQRERRGLLIEDGWTYFIHGWTQVIAEVFHIDITGERLAACDRLAREMRKGRQGEGSVMKVLTTPRSYGKTDPEVFAMLRAAGLEVVRNETGGILDKEGMKALLADCDGVIVGVDPIDAEVIAAAPKLKAIAKYGVGVDNIDLDAAKARDIKVSRTVGANAEAVADYAMALLLAVARKTVLIDQHCRQGDWKKITTRDVTGGTIGILGLGAIGRNVAQRAQGFGMKVLAHDPFWDEAYAKAHGITRAAPDEIFAECDVISLHLPLTPETENFIGAAELAKMKPDAILINTARGGLIDENALLDALEAGRLCGAGIDAFSSEPPKDPRWFTLDNVVLGSHCAASTAGASRNMGRMATANLIHDLGL